MTSGSGAYCTSTEATRAPLPIPAVLTTPLIKPACWPSPRGWRSSSAAPAAPSAAPVIRPCRARAANSMPTEWATANSTPAPNSPIRERVSTGRLPTSSEMRPMSSSAVSTPKQ